jgi:hypothetical protein
MNRQSEWHNRYDKTHCKGVYLKLNLRTDADIIEKLASVPNKQGYIKQLIRRDLYENYCERRDT